MNYEKSAAGRFAHVHAAYDMKHAHYTTRNIRNQFNREKLPAPVAVLGMFGMKPGKANRAGYWVLICPFHKNGQEKNPSLHLHQVTGHFRCHACGAKGRDILAFYQQLTGRGFVDAAKDLGAWEASNG